MENKEKQVQSRAIIEILGKPKEHVEKTIKEYTEAIKKKEDLQLLQIDISEAKEVDKEQALWSAFAELEIQTPDLQTLIEFCFDYMPSSIEIIKPEELTIKDKATTNLLNDLQAKLHRIDMITKQLNNENTFLKKNMQSLLKNFISITLFKAEKTSENLAKIIGMDEEALEKFLEKMIEEKIITKKEDKYQLAK